MRPTPQDLLEAVERNDLDAVLKLLELGVDPSAQDKYGMTALSRAVRNRRIDIVEVLLRRGAALDGGDICHGNAMTWAAAEARAGELYHQAWRGRESDRRFFEMLKEAGGRCDLREAVLMGDVELARRICDQDPTVDVSGDALFPVHDTFLMIAADLGERAMVDFLLERGADPNGTDDLGITALMRAAAAGHAPVVERLITGGARINQSWPYQTALSMAEAEGHKEAAAVLLSRGAKRRLIDAIEEDDPDLAARMLDEGMDPNETYCDMSSLSGYRFPRLIHRAVIKGDVAITRLLLEHGASIKDPSGWAWLLEVTYIREGDFHNPNLVDWEPSQLAEAARLGYVDLVQLLLEHGANVADPGREGLNALEWARRNQHEDIVRELNGR